MITKKPRTLTPLWDPDFDLELGLWSLLDLSIGNSLDLGCHLHCSWSVGPQYTCFLGGYTRNWCHQRGDLFAESVDHYSDVTRFHITGKLPTCSTICEASNQAYTKRQHHWTLCGGGGGGGGVFTGNWRMLLKRSQYVESADDLVWLCHQASALTETWLQSA